MFTPERTRRALERLGLWQQADGRPGWPDREVRIPCPIHRGKDDNFKLCADGQWFCHSQCGRGGGVLDLIAELEPVTRDNATAWYLGDEASQPGARISTHGITRRVPQTPATATVSASTRGERPRDMKPALYVYRLLADLEDGTNNPRVSKKITRQQQAGRSTPSKRSIWQIWTNDKGWQASSKGSELNRRAFGRDDMPERFWYTEALKPYATLEFRPGGDVAVSLATGDRAPADPRLWIAEGEECATLLAEAGLCATTGPNGASSFKRGMPDIMAAFLARWPAGVVVLPDNDKPGAEYAAAVARATQAAGVPVWVVHLPDLPAKGDVLDWAWESGYLPSKDCGAAATIDAHGIRRGLLEAVSEAGEWEDLPEPEQGAQADDWEEFTGDEILAMPDAPMPVLFRDGKGSTVIPAGLLLLGGAPKMGKTWAALDMAISFVTGRPAFGLLWPSCDPEDQVLYVNCDLQDYSATLKPRIALLAEGKAVPRLRVVTPTPEQKDNALVARVLRMVKSNPKIRFVIVDTITGARSGEAGRRGGNLQSQEMGQTVAWREVQRQGAAVLLVCHTRKGLAVDPLEAIAGTNGMTGSTDEVMTLTGRRGAPGAQIFMAGRTCKDRTVLLERCGGGNWRALEIADGTGGAGTTEQRQTVLELAEQQGGKVRASDLQEELEMTADNARAVLKRMATGGQLLRQGRGVYCLPPANRTDAD